jgi:eukaryotic translation initiation factor 2C
MRWLSKNTMMVGIDVTHPGMGTQEGTPSIAAVVASVDDKFVQFPASLRIQKAQQMKEVSGFLQRSKSEHSSCSNIDVG